MKNFSQLVEEIRKVRKRIALICPNDEHSYYIVERCLKEELTDFLLIVERSHRAHGEALRSLSPAHVQLFEVDSLEEAARKGVMLVHEGQADVLIFPNIESSNVFYKTLTLFAGSRMAAVLRGTAVPVVVTSRADSGLSKYHSLSLACKIGDS